MVRRRAPILPLVVAATALLLMAAWVSDAHAAESTRLSYVRGSGAEECPDERALRLAVAIRLGYDPFVAWANKTIHAQVARDGSKLRARVYLAGEDGRARGSRELVGSLDDCDHLIAALSLAISIAIDPMSANRPSESPSDVASLEAAPESTEREDAAAVPRPAIDDERQRPAGADDVRVAPLAPAPKRADASPLRWYAGLGGKVSKGTAPDYATGVAAFARLQMGISSMGLEARYDLPAGVSATSRGGIVRSTLVLLSIEPCLWVRSFAFCGLASVGSLSGSGLGVASPQEQSALYFGAGGRAAFELPVAKLLSIRLHADLVSNLTRVTLRINEENAWQAPPLAGSAGLDAVALIW
ncbi:MAG TPA: hypothetical protein VK550_27265 [Polyangiaceae bacterium]|nr:hypothetical protein [Polyangiaceae bacterium]